MIRLLGMKLTSERIAEELSAIDIKLVGSAHADPGSSANDTQNSKSLAGDRPLSRSGSHRRSELVSSGYNEIPVEYPAFVLAAIH